MATEKTVDISIDENQLDREWIAQPDLYRKWAYKLALAKRDLDEAKADLETTRVDMDAKVRQNPEVFGLKKITENGVSNVVIGSDEFREANEQLIQARFEVNKVEAVVNSLDHRKTALVKLVDLLLADYFSTPRARGGSRERMEEVEKQSTRRGKLRKREPDE